MGSMAMDGDTALYIHATDADYNGVKQDSRLSKRKEKAKLIQKVLSFAVVKKRMHR